MSPADDSVLKRFRAALDEIYGDRVERVVLFGSRARGDARTDSDYDVAVFLRNMADRWQEVGRIIPIVTDILHEDEAFIHAMPYRPNTADAGDTPRGRRFVTRRRARISTKRVNA